MFTRQMAMQSGEERDAEKKSKARTGVEAKAVPPDLGLMTNGLTVRQQTIIRMQQTVGNQAVRRMLNKVVQRDDIAANLTATDNLPVSGPEPLIGERVRLPRMDDVVKSPSVENARQKDWEDGLQDYQERGAWIVWQSSSPKDANGNRDDTRASYKIVPWPLPSVGANDDAPSENPNDAIESGTPPANDSMNFCVGHYHQHPPLDPKLKREPSQFPVGPSPQDEKYANQLRNPGIVRDFETTDRKKVKDYRYGPAVAG